MTSQNQTLACGCEVRITPAGICWCDVSNCRDKHLPLSTVPVEPKPRQTLSFDISERVDAYLQGKQWGVKSPLRLTDEQLYDIRWAVEHYASKALKEFGLELVSTITKAGLGDDPY